VTLRFWALLGLLALAIMVFALLGSLALRAQDITVTRTQEGPRILLWCRPVDGLRDCRPVWRFAKASECTRTAVHLNNKRDERIDRGEAPGDIATCRVENTK
jgi:hypothetical protein